MIHEQITIEQYRFDTTHNK